MSVIKSISGLAAATGVALALFVAPANAAILYDNGPANGTIDAWTLNYGYSVADSFTLGSASTLTGATFSLWNNQGDLTQTIDWSIVTDPAAGTTLASGTAAVSQSFQFSNGSGYDINLDSISLPNIALAAGNYWLELQNAVTSGRSAAYWDMNGGPSQIWESAIGFNPNPADYAAGLNSTSNPFQIIGTSGGPGGASVPEPAMLALFGLGLVGLGLSRRKR